MEIFYYMLGAVLSLGNASIVSIYYFDKNKKR